MAFSWWSFYSCFSFSDVGSVGVKHFSEVKLQVSLIQMLFLWLTLAGGPLLYYFVSVSFMHWWEDKVLGLETYSLNGISLIPPRGRANRICWFLPLETASREDRQTAWVLCINIARSKALNILYSKYLMTIHKPHYNSHRSIKVSFTLFAFSSAMSSPFSTGYERGVWMCYVFYIDWAGLFNSIAAYPYLERQWKSFENQWAEAGKTKIIDLLSNSCRQQNN